MVKVSYKKSSRRVELIVDGHAGWSKKGSDIVCAGISALVSTLANYLLRQGNEKECICTVKEGYAHLCSHEEESFLLFDFVYTGLVAIGKMYPKHLFVTISDQQR